MKKISLQNSIISFGTCSWKYESWNGIVYSDTKTPAMLTEYAQVFSSVEIDQWFWALNKPGGKTLPDTKDAAGYASSTPDDFRFTIKAPNSITLTHFYQKNPSEKPIPNPDFLSIDLVNRFLESIEPILPKTALIMFQFEYLNKLKMPSQQVFEELFIAFAENLPSGTQFGVEIRNPQFLNNRFFSLLKKQGISPVFLQGYYMPPVFPLLKQYGTKAASPLVIRLHGPDRTGIEKLTDNKWNSIAIPRDAEIDELVDVLCYLSTLEAEIYLNVNNHYEGSAPLTINKIYQKLISQN